MPAQECSGDKNLGASLQVAGEGGEGAAVGLQGDARSPGSPGPAPTLPPGNPQPRAGMLLDLYLEEEEMNFLHPFFFYSPR